MELEKAAALLAVLGQTTRLKVVTILAEHRPDGLPASQIADMAGTPRNTMSGHLGILANAGIVTSSRTGRNITYRICEEMVVGLADLVGGLASERGQPATGDRRHGDTARL